jgi:hypothetical protein
MNTGPGRSYLYPAGALLAVFLVWLGWIAGNGHKPQVPEQPERQVLATESNDRKPTPLTITSLICIQPPTKSNPLEMNSDERYQLLHALDNSFMADREFDCLAEVDPPVAGEKVEWHLIAGNVSGYSRNQTLVTQTSTVGEKDDIPIDINRPGSRKDNDTIKKAVKIHRPGSYRFELHFEGTNIPAKSLSFTVRPSSAQPSGTPEVDTTEPEGTQNCCDCGPESSDNDCFMKCNAMIPRCSDRRRTKNR